MIQEEYDYRDKLKAAVGSHKAWMEQFREIVFPTFEVQGFTFPEAVLIYKMNAISNAIWDTHEGPPKEDWET